MKGVSLILVMLIIFVPVLLVLPVAKAQEFPHVEASKVVNPVRTEAGATLQVTIHLRGAGGVIQTPVDVVLIIDKSGSMLGKKIADAKEAAITFLDYNNEKDRVGLVAFSTTVQVVSSLTFMTSTNKDLFKTKINSIQAAGSTDMYDAIVAANNMLLAAPRSNAPLVEILLTDGNHNWPSILPDSSFQDLANQAKAKDIIIYTIGLGSDVSASRLQMIAQTTGGEYYFAATSDQLKGIYHTIGSKLLFAGTDINVTETIPSYLTYNDDATQGPSVSSSGDAVVLQWHVGALKIGQEWEATYTAQAQRAVEAVSTVVQCKVEYMTSESARALINLTPGIVFHDISVTELKAVPGSVDKGAIVTLEIAVTNNGLGHETFDLRTTYDGSILDSRTVSIDGGASTSVTLHWNTSDVDTRKYEITTTADPDENIWEMNRNDNTAKTTVEVIGTSGGSVFLIIALIIIITAAVAGVAYAGPKLRGSGYMCPVDRVALKYSYTARQWYCPRCGRPYQVR
jgi:Mg-chelatase subunit ChlD